METPHGGASAQSKARAVMGRSPVQVRREAGPINNEWCLGRRGQHPGASAFGEE